MLTAILPITGAAPRLAGGALLFMLGGCAGDALLLPRDGAPAELRQVSGDDQSAPAGDPVDRPLVVEAVDALNRPVPGAVIVFEFLVPPAGAELTPGSTETNEVGQASAQVVLGTTVGSQPVEARLDDPSRDLSVRFQLTALQPDDEGGGDGDGGDGGGDDDGNGGGGGGGDDDGDGGSGGGGDNGGGGGCGDDGNGGGDDDDDDNEGGGGGGDDDDDDGHDNEGNGNGKDKGHGKGGGD